MGLTKEIGIMQGRLSPRIDGKIQANISPDELERILTKETD
jgi:hypothetical protein